MTWMGIKNVRVSGRFVLLRVRVIWIQLYFKFVTTTPRNSGFGKGVIWRLGYIAYSVHWLCGSLKRYLNCGGKISRLQLIFPRTQRETQHFALLCLTYRQCTLRVVFVNRNTSVCSTLQNSFRSLFIAYLAKNIVSVVFRFGNAVTRDDQTSNGT